MIDDKELNTLLSSYNPTLSENTEFLHSLEKKLHAIDVVMDYKAKETRHYRRHAVLCFLAGALMGIFLLTPLPIPDGNYPTDAEPIRSSAPPHKHSILCLHCLHSPRCLWCLHTT